MSAALTVLVFSAGHACAQDTLTVGQPIDRAIVAGATDEYPIALEAGGDVAGAVDQRGYLKWRGTLADGLIALAGTEAARPPSR
jgi:hypothetical protein